MKPVAISALVIMLSACSTPSMTLSALAPADPDSRSAPRPYVSVTSGTVNYQPVEPRPWIQSNQGVSPEGEAE